MVLTRKYKLALASDFEYDHRLKEVISGAVCMSDQNWTDTDLRYDVALTEQNVVVLQSLYVHPSASFTRVYVQR